jgi:transcriptional repressor of cell division inhibition gene dicB
MSTVIAIASANFPAYSCGMRTKDVINHFGSQAAVARALGIAQPSVANWPDEPPPLRQLQIERLTAGRLRADPSILLPKRAVA